MKKNIGSKIALYPTPLVVVGAMVNGKPNWLLVGHLGIMGHDHIMISLAKAHYTNQGVIANKALSVNIVTEEWLKKADHVGCVSGHKEDKSTLFEYEVGESGAPLLTEARLTMECTLEDTYETQGFDNFILKIKNTFADDSILTEKDIIDYRKLKPVLFEMPSYEYLKTGDVIGKCMKLN